MCVHTTYYEWNFGAKYDEWLASCFGAIIRTYILYKHMHPYIVHSVCMCVCLFPAHRVHWCPGMRPTRERWPCLALPWFALPALPCFALPCLALSCHAMPCHAMPCLYNTYILHTLLSGGTIPIVLWIKPNRRTWSCIQ